MSVVSSTDFVHMVVQDFMGHAHSLWTCCGGNRFRGQAKKIMAVRVASLAYED